MDEFKADKRNFYFLNSKDRSYNVLLEAINGSNKIIRNRISIKKNLFEISVDSVSIIEKLGIGGTNINDFFEVVKKFEPKV